LPRDLSGDLNILGRNMSFIVRLYDSQADLLTIGTSPAAIREHESKCSDLLVALRTSIDSWVFSDEVTFRTLFETFLCARQYSWCNTPQAQRYVAHGQWFTSLVKMDIDADSEHLVKAASKPIMIVSKETQRRSRRAAAANPQNYKYHDSEEEDAELDKEDEGSSDSDEDQPPPITVTSKYKNRLAVIAESEHRERVRAKFDEYGLGQRCEEICAQLGVTCVSDLVYVGPEDVEELKLSLVSLSLLSLSIFKSPC
jgi:hypothetical protein